ncbi:hypothetical protein NLJ89_g6763 [Agrocybe chaxingu]|uniref:SGNH hydrolase-type esterase domain-containing protein n=1 Tax=Agrocybe chaxingu TaxID=84603 RepID=A0A9W8MUC1_9AGAR|nr:hypothetical protein NLJ89_g6763 [Agrocybe chaxingu]
MFTRNLVLSALSASAFVLPSALALAVKTVPPTSFVLVGDSTTANGTTPNSGGWGNGFCGSTITGNAASLAPGTPCINTARNGATTGTFVADGFWDASVAAIKGEVAKGRRTYSMGANLTAMVEEVRALGAEPVLVTSLTRRSFRSNGTVADTLGPWADETILIAQQQNTHVLDLHAASIKYVEAIGPDAAHRLNRLPEDNTRTFIAFPDGETLSLDVISRVSYALADLNINGTTVFGRMVADLISASFPGQLPVIPNPALTFNISHGIASF